MDTRGAHSFWRSASAWFGAFGVYIVVLLATDADSAETVNNTAWTLAPIGAAYAARSAAKHASLSAKQRQAWNTIALACISWWIGQLIWDYYAVYTDGQSQFVGVSKLFYLGYAALMVRALGQLSDLPAPSRFTLQHLGNLGLIGCCLAVTVVIVFLEPLAAMDSRSGAIAVSLLHSTLVAATLFAALYYLWTHRWQSSWLPMVLLVAATAVYTIGNFFYVHALLIQTYQFAGWVNVTWILMFLLIGVSAHLRISISPSDTRESSHMGATARRARLLEAAIPALLIIVMVVVGFSTPSQLSPRVLVTTAILMLMFALILGAREAWIQRESQRLTLELRGANERLRTANLELQESEARVRDLNVHLEERVAERTRQLQIAYEELEGFAYAVAHDLKAPLRAIDGFGHMLSEALHDRADEQTQTYLQRIRRSAVKMAALIDDLLAYSRIERRTLVEQSIDLREVIAELIEESSHDIKQRGVELRIDVPAIRLRADPEGLLLVLRNVMQNALKFSRGAQPPRIAVQGRVDARTLTITVSDNGIGFDMQYHDQIFKLFHRLHRDEQYQGTGIGLALVRKALERMNGSVRAESRVGEGATFIVDLMLPQ